MYAFEPVPRNLAYLKEPLRLNEITNVQVVEAAVSDRTGVTSSQEGSSNATGRITQGRDLKVASVTLDELTTSGGLPAPHYIKIDVEGAEMLVLSSPRAMLERVYRTIFLATHGDEVRRQRCDFLESLGYTLRPMEGDGIEPSNEFLAQRAT